MNNTLKTTILRAEYPEYGDAVTITRFSMEDDSKRELVFHPQDWERLVRRSIAHGSTRVQKLFFDLSDLDNKFALSFEGSWLFDAFVPLAESLGPRHGIRGAFVEPRARPAVIGAAIDLWVAQFEALTTLEVKLHGNAALFWLLATSMPFLDPSVAQLRCDLKPHRLYERFLRVGDSTLHGDCFRWEAVSYGGGAWVIGFGGTQHATDGWTPKSIGPIVSAGTTLRIPADTVITADVALQAQHLTDIVERLKLGRSIQQSTLAA
jgi:hypothetical protein